MKNEEVKINTEYIKLDSFLKLAGICSTGGEAKLYIINGDVAVNGEVCFMRGKKLYSGDKVKINDKELSVI